MMHLLDKGIDGIEAGLIPEPRNEPQPERPVVLGCAFGDRPIPVEDVGLDGAGRSVEGGAGADMDCRGPLATVGQDRDPRIHPIGRGHESRLEVRGGEADGPPPLITPDDGALDLVGTGHDSGGIADTGVREQPADDGARGGDHGLIGEIHLYRGDDDDLEGVPASEFGEGVDGARAGTPEVEIRPLDDRGRSETIDHLLDERFGGLREQVGGGFEAVDLIGPGLPEPCLTL